MKIRAAQLGIASLSFAACGHLDLGDYDPLSPPEAHGSASAGGAPDREPESGGAEHAGQPELGQGGAARELPETSGGAGAATAGEGGEVGDGGEGGEPPARSRRKKSCELLPSICGTELIDCCSVGYIGAGSFVRGAEGACGEAEPRSHVSAFNLGIFEVTVGRFGAFLDDYDAWRATGHPFLGEGQHPLIPGSGWNPAWLRKPGDDPSHEGLAATAAEVEDGVTRCLEIPFSTKMWQQPVNCVTFYEAQAFCIWDGGRLPTALEWEYAAAGGDQNRPYPWGDATPTEALARYGCSATVDVPCLIPPVGTYPIAKSRFGPLDLAGSLSEWNFDTFGAPFSTPCSDCANISPIDALNPRSIRGGDWTSRAEALKTTWNNFIPANLHLPMHGFRCAYDVEKGQ